MADASVTIRALRKRYAALEVLCGVDLEVPSGSVFGLVGLNGSGKTTTIECVLGLQRHDSGDVRVLGSTPRDLHLTRGRVGAAFDSPCLHPGLTVRQVFEQAAGLAPERARVPADLEELLGISRYRHMRTHKLSLGNRKRAAIAQALLLRPSLVILDEPFAGLDAAGVDGVIALIRQLHRDEGTTFVLSSHQLPYLECLCTHFGILADGAIARAGDLPALLEDEGTRLVLRVEPVERARQIVEERDDVRSCATLEDGRLAIESGGVDPATLNRVLVEAGLEVSELVTERPSLAVLFRAMTGRSMTGCSMTGRSMTEGDS